MNKFPTFASRHTTFVALLIGICLLISPAAFGANLINNGGFEHGSARWKQWPRGLDFFSIQKGLGVEGSSAAIIKGTPAGHGHTLYQYANVSGGQIYALSFHYRVQSRGHSDLSGQIGVKLLFRKPKGGNGSAGQLDHAIDLSSAVKAGSRWQQASVIFVAPSSASSAQLGFYISNTGAWLWLDNVRLRHLGPVKIRQTASAPKIDGHLNDSVWKNAQPLEGFWYVSRRSKLADTDTTAYMAYDKNNLYIAFKNQEPHLSQRKLDITQRDGKIWTNDSNELFIVGPTGRKGVHLLVSGKNVQADFSMTRNQADDPVWHRDWNGKWQSAVFTGKKAWYVEMKIPFTTLGFAPKAGQTWTINLGRERYVGPAQRMQWNRAIGGFGTLAHFASLKFQGSHATLTRFIQNMSREPLALELPEAQFKSLLSNKPGNYSVGSWTSEVYRGQYPPSVQKKYTKAQWLKQRALPMLNKYGQAGMYGPKFPWVSMNRNLGWDVLEQLNKKYGMKFPLSIYNSSLNRKAIQQGAKWYLPGNNGNGRVSIIDPALLDVIENFVTQFIHSDPRVRKLLYEIDAIDEPTNGVTTTFSPTRRPKMKDALAKLNEKVKEKYGYGKYGLYDAAAPVTKKTPFERITFYTWWNHRLAQAIAQLQKYFAKIAPGVPFMGFDVNATSTMNFVAPWLVSRSVAALCTDPYPTKTMAQYSRARALYHTGFTTKFLKDVTGKRLRVIPQGFIYYGGVPTPTTVRQWASQALKNGANGLRWYAAGPAPFTIPKAYDEMIRINGIVHRMNHLPLPDKTKTAIFFSQATRWAQNDQPMNGAYSLYVLLGEKLGAWFEFVTDIELTHDADALNSYKLIYVPGLEYVDKKVAQRLIDRAKAGATLVIFDPKAFTWAPDGTKITALRQEAGGATLAGKQKASRVVVAGNAGIPGLKAGATLPLTKVAGRVGSGSIEAFALSRLPTGAVVLAKYPDGSPAAYRVQVGKGAVIWFAAQPFGNANLAIKKTPWLGFLKALEQHAGEKLNLPIWNFLIPPA